MDEGTLARVRAALDTEEIGDGLVHVARGARDSELTLARAIRVAESFDERSDDLHEVLKIMRGEK